MCFKFGLDILKWEFYGFKNRVGHEPEGGGSGATHVEERGNLPLWGVDRSPQHGWRVFV